MLHQVLGGWSLIQTQLANWATELSRPHTSPSRQLSFQALRARARQSRGLRDIPQNHAFVQYLVTSLESIES